MQLSQDNPKEEKDLFLEIEQNAEEFEAYQTLEEEREAQGPEEPEQSDDENHFMINGQMAIELLDIGVSRLTSVGFMLAKIPSHFTDFQLTAEEKKTIAPLIEKWLEYEKFDVNPRTALAGALLTVYGLKGYSVIDRHKQAKKEGKVEELKKVAVKNKGGRPAGSKDTKPRQTRKRKTEAEQKDENNSNRRP